jgi:prefoldin subunit 5
MSLSPKTWRVIACLAILIAGLALLLSTDATFDRVWQRLKPQMIQQNADLRAQNEQLKHEISALEKQNTRLRNHLDEYERNLSELRYVAAECEKIESMLPADLPAGIKKERFEIRRLYRELLGEKNRWDQYQQQKYAGILEDTIEPRVVDSQSLKLENKENLDHFVELEKGLALHRRLIRDVRLFHDEIQFQKEQRYARQDYELYDLKFQLPPFARESALTDALQQAMSALSAGIYQEEAIEVLSRIGEALTQPIQQLNAQLRDTSESGDAHRYNYDLYTVYGKKLMQYADSLTRQSAITLAPSAFGELDFFNRKVFDSLYDLYEVGRDGTIDPADLDLKELERIINSNS